MDDPLWCSYAEEIIREVENPEKEELVLRLKNEWEVGGQFWFPLEIKEDEAKPPHAEAFHSGSIAQELTYQRLREILAAHGITKLFEMREGGDMWEIDLAEFYPSYAGLEGYWFTERVDWLVYASHEITTTISGAWLLPEVKAVWPDWERCVWTPPPHW